MSIIKKLLFVAAMSLGIAALAAGQELPQLPNDPAVRTGKLDNGLTYYIRHNANPENRAEFYLATNVGALQEEPDQDGLAHFLEHMCFNGTKNFPGKSILNWLESIGASFGGNVNASTGVEQTIYLLNNIPYPAQADVSNMGMVYYIMSPGELDYSNPVDQSDYQAWLNSQLGGGQEQSIAWQNITAANIQALRSGS